MSINDKIKKEMKARGWTVYRLSKMSGVSKTAISSWFAFVPTTPKYVSIEKVAKAFGMKPTDFLPEKKQADPKTQEMLEMWNRLEKAERETVVELMRTILNHNK